MLGQSIKYPRDSAVSRESPTRTHGRAAASSRARCWHGGAPEVSLVASTRHHERPVYKSGPAASGPDALQPRPFATSRRAARETLVDENSASGPARQPVAMCWRSRQRHVVCSLDSAKHRDQTEVTSNDSVAYVDQNALGSVDVTDLNVAESRLQSCSRGIVRRAWLAASRSCSAMSSSRNLGTLSCQWRRLQSSSRVGRSSSARRCSKENPRQGRIQDAAAMHFERHWLRCSCRRTAVRSL